MVRNLFLFFVFCFLFGLTASSQNVDTINLDPINIISFYWANDKIPTTQKTFDIEKNSTNTKEVPIYLSTTPSITSNSDGGYNIGYSYMRMRGVDQTRINFTLDGIPLNEPEDQGFYSSNFPDFISSMNSVQIIRGIGQSNYGTSSYVGSVNFESKNLSDNSSLIFIRDFGSYNTNKRSFEINSRDLIKKMRIYYRFSNMKTDGYKEHSGSDGNSSFFKIGYYDDNKKDAIKFVFFNGDVDNNLAWYGVTKQQMELYGRRYNANTINETDTYKQILTYLQHNHNINNNSNITTTLYYNKLDGYWAYDFGDIIRYNVMSDYYGLISNYIYDKNGFKINIGVSGSLYNRIHFGDTPDRIKLYENKGIKNGLTAYSKFSYTYKNFTSYIDIQENLMNYKFVKDNINANSLGMPNKKWDFFNPKGGLLYSLDNNKKIYFSIGKTYREPTRADMFGGVDNLDSIYRFIDIEEESVVDYEFGLKIDNELMKYNLNYFYMNFDNEITLSGAIGQNGLPLMTSVKKSFRSGIESDLNYSFHRKKFVFYNNFTFMYNKIKTNYDGDLDPVMTPSFLINTRLDYNYKKKYILSTEYKYISSRWIDIKNTAKLEPFNEINFSLKYVGSNIDVSFCINNLFNNKNFSTAYMGYENEILYMVSAERNYYLSLIFKLCNIDE